MIIGSPPLVILNHYNNWYKIFGACQESLKGLKPKIKMYKREIPKLNKENFLAWQRLMRLHLSSIGDFISYYLGNDYIEVLRPMVVEQMKEK